MVGRSRVAALVAVVLTLLVIAVLSGGAGARVGLGELKYACASKSNGLMRFTEKSGQCKNSETAVTIKPGPVFVCVKPDDSVRLISDLASCTPLPKALALTLPPTSGRVYFCAALSDGVLRYVTNPSECKSSQRPLFVSPGDDAPSVTSTSPANGASNVAVDADVTVDFNESVTASAGAFTLVCGGTSKTFTLSGSPGSSLTLDPTADLPEGTSCTVTAVAASISDTDTLDPPDHPSANYVFSFTSDSAPSVTSTVPAGGASGVDPSGNITVTFSEPVTATTSSFTLECPTGTGKTFTVGGSGTSTITLDPAADLPGATGCTVTVIANQISDVDSGDPPDNLAGNHVFSFTTADAAPSVTTTTPANGATGVAVNSNITVNFSESVTVTTSSFTLECPTGAAKAFALSGSPGSAITLNPTADLPAGTTCTVTAVAANISDTDAIDPPDHPAADFVFSFSTDSAPAVTTTTPANSATGVDPTANITVSFSEAVDVTTSSFTISCNAALQAFGVSGSGTSTITLDPTADLPSTANCTVTAVAANISDTDTGDPPDHPAANHVFSFATQDAAPSVTTTTPTNGATDVARSSNITVNFSEAVTASGSSFTLECPTGSAQAFTLSGSPGATITLDPNADLPSGAVCTVTVVANQISDVDAIDPPDNMAANFVFSFTVVANHAPTAADQSVSTNEDNAKTITLAGTDADGNALTFSIVSGPSHGLLGSIGTVTCSGTPSSCTADVQYTPALNYNGPDSFTFKTNDGQVDSTTNGTVSIMVNAVDDPPTLVDDPATVLEDSAATTIDVLANDTDPDGGPKTITAKTNGANGATVTITNAGADLTYQPAANFCGSDSFTYTVNGGPTGTVNVTVTCVNDAPSFSKGANQGPLDNQNANGTAKAYTVSGWATAISRGPANESGQTVDFVIDSVTPSNLFTVQPAVAANGDLTFTTDPAHSGTATVVLHIHDNGGTANSGVDASATQSFTIQTVNPAPIAVDDSYTATGNVSINVNQTAEGVLQRGTDDTLFSATITHCGPTTGTATAVSGSTCTTASASGGSVVLNTNGQFTYNPPAGFLGADHFFYKLTNSGGSDVGDVTVTVGDMIWFFDSSNGSAGDGRLSNPFQQISSFVNDNTALHGKDNQTLFISNGTYDDPLTLRTGQILVGKGAGAAIVDIPTTNHIVLAPFSVSLPTTGGTRPSLTTASGSAITLGSGNTIRGLNVDNTAVSDIAGLSFGTLALSEVTLAGTGQALDLTTGTANATFDSVSSSSGTNGIKLSSVAGTLNFGSGGALSGSTGSELLVSGGTNTWNYPGTITKTTAGKTVDISGRTGGAITLSGAISGTGSVNNGIALATNTGATISLTGGVALSTGGSDAFTATGGGTVNVTGSANTLATTTGTALNIANTTIGASDLNFRSISAGTNASGPADGIVLNNTGSSGGLTVAGTGSANSGGTIQHTTSHGIVLTNTKDASFNNMNIQSTAGSGVRGTTGVTNFTFTNGTINNSGTGDGNQESNIAFNDPSGSATDAKVTGTVTITGNTLTNALWFGVSILQFAGALDDVNISNNTLTSGTTTGTGGNSFGSGIQLFAGGVASTSLNVTRAELNGNTITNFPGGVPIAVQCGTSNGTGPTASCGAPGSATNDIEIKNNILNGGGTTPNGAGGVILPNQVMLLTVNGRGQGQFTVQNNGTVGDPLSGSAGNIIDISAGGAVTVQATVTGNQIDAAGQTVSGTSGIAAGVGPFTVTGPTVLSTATLYATVQNNAIHNSAGTGLRLNVNAGDPTLNAVVTGNTVGTPISATYGIQIVEGNNAGFTGNTNLQISGNTSAGGTGGGNTFPGIGLRKFGTASGEFSIVGLSPSPATNAQMESYVSGQNPSSASGSFGTGGTAAVNGSSNNWTAIGAVPTPP